MPLEAAGSTVSNWLVVPAASVVAALPLPVVRMPLVTGGE
jgi:hypothetical protein